jgi:sigma-B regulation protein RsbU (phosphoserine phosphatase)
MFRKIRIAPRMALMIIIGAGGILGAVIGYNYISARGLLLEELQEKSNHLARATAFRIEVTGYAVEKVVQSAAFMLTENKHTVAQQYDLLEKLVRDNPEIFGAAIAPWPKGKAPYVWRDVPPAQTLLRGDLNAEGYQYDVWDWFALPRDLTRTIWTEPYFDEGGGNVLMVTRAAPVWDAEDEFAGVITSDVSLEWLQEMLAQLPVGRSGYAFLVSATGVIISHPAGELIMNESIFSLAEARGSKNLRKIGQRMIQGETGFVFFDGLTDTRPAWLAFSPVPSTGWSVGLVFPEKELLGVVFDFSRNTLFFGAAGFVLLLVMSLLIARSISRPLQQLEAGARTLATGNLDVSLPVVTGKDEVAGLANAFESMRNDLKRYMIDLAQTTAAKERIESEMQIARDIQMSLVPHTFPPFPNRNDMEIYAILEPAREIGGDFYDFYMIDEDELCLVVGDVSGKGVPAALFMAVTRTFLRSIWQEEHSPAATMTRLNRELVRDNDSCMFVTLFCARINLTTGHCVYANGGHNPPFLLHAGKPAMAPPTVKGVVVGGMPDFTFDEGELLFAPGDAIFIYTDGVTEAMNPENALSGDAWTLEQIEKYRDLDCNGMVEAMRRALADYTRGAEQSDDITMLAFRRG